MKNTGTDVKLQLVQYVVINMFYVKL